MTRRELLSVSTSTRKGKAKMKVLIWIVGIIFLIGLAVVLGLGGLIF